MIHSVQMVHYDSLNVNLGDIVNQGDKLGVMGETGNAQGAHVHLTIIPVKWTSPTTRWGITDVLSYGGTRGQIIDFLDNLSNPLFKRNGVLLPYRISYGGGWWGVDSSYQNHYALDLIPQGAQTPLPDVVWPYPVPGKVVAINKTDRNAGLWTIIEVDFDGDPPDPPDPPDPKDRKGLPIYMMIKYF